MNETQMPPKAPPRQTPSTAAAAIFTPVDPPLPSFRYVFKITFMIAASLILLSLPFFLFIELVSAIND